MILDIFALVVIGVLIALIIFLVVLIGPIPGNIANKRGHPQADAIGALGWIGIITLGLAWPIALVWAYTRSGEQHADYLSERVATLEAELSAMKIQGGDA
jgi:amino acid transporter